MDHQASVHLASEIFVVNKINRGEVHPDAVDLLGDNLLYALEKPDKGTRPIGVGAALRRLAGRCIMHDLGDRMGEVLTTTKPDADTLAAAGHARDRACNAPLQVGVGIKGGAEIAIATVRVALQRRPD